MRKSLAAIVCLMSLGLACSRSQTPDAAALRLTVRAEADIQAIVTQLKLYQGLNGFLPTTEQGLQALVSAPASDPKSRMWRQLMDKVPVDPWGNPCLYKKPGIHHPNSFDVYSSGPDGKADTADDIGNW